MNRILYSVVFLCILALTASQALAQVNPPPTLTKDDFNAWYTFGDTLTRFTDSVMVETNIGDTGYVPLWDFSNLAASSALTLSIMDPASTPHTADFPGATHALKTTLTEFQGMAVSGDLYFYHMVNDTILAELGDEAAGKIAGIDASVKIFRVPYNKWYGLPLTLGSYWTATDSMYQLVYIILFGNPTFSPDFSDTTFNSSEFTVDAWGTMKLPDGSMHTAFRIREHLLTASGTVRYEFLGKDGSRVAFSAMDPNAPPRGMIGVRAVEWNGPMVAPTAVAETKEVPRQYSLEQNYPNPFNPSTTIRYGLPAQGRVRLELFNVIGQQVATLVDANQEAGYHTVQFNGAGLPSGLYFYRITSGSFVQTMKMVLAK